MTARAFVIGGTGQIGSAIVGRFVSEGWDVTVASRSGPRSDRHARVHHVCLDRTQPEALADVVPTGVDVLIDVVPMTAADAGQLLKLGDRIGCVIAISTGAVYSDESGRTLDEAVDESTFPRYPVPLSEAQGTVSPGGGSYSTRKAAMERRLLDSAKVPTTILRPFAVHGPGSPGPREWWVVKRVLDGRPFIPLAGRGRSRFHTTSVDNLTELTWLAANHPGTRVLNAADPTALTVHEITEAILSLLGSSAALVLADGHHDGVGDTPWTVYRDIVADMSAAGAELGYRAVTDYPTAVGRTVQWLCRDIQPGDWQQRLPDLARYPGDLFDYPAEDAWLRRLTLTAQG
jgi:nucleoside-diphosphate-sugar epimerase